MTLVNATAGAVTHIGFTVNAKVTGTTARLVVADNPGLSGPARYARVTPTPQGVVLLAADGLTPQNDYWWAVEEDGQLHDDMGGHVKTAAAVGDRESFTFWHATCAGLASPYPGPSSALAPDRLSNHPVFDSIRQMGPDFGIHGGDLHYYDPGSGVHVPDTSLATYRTAFDDVMSCDRQHRLYREVPWVYMWDDHDLYGNDGNSASPGRENAAQVYRERVPHYPLPDSGAVYHSFQRGRVLFLVTDTRYYSDPPYAPEPRSLLGATQKQWMETVLTQNTGGAEFLIWVQGNRYPGGLWNDNDYTDRDDMAQLFGDTGWLRRMFSVMGDAHEMAIDSGANNDYGGFPLFVNAPLDGSSGGALGTYDISGTPRIGRGQFGMFYVNDRGHRIDITGQARFHV